MAVVKPQPNGTATMQTRVVGSTFCGPEALPRLIGLKMGQMLRLVREPNNPADVNAVAVYFYTGKLGYIPRELAKRVAPAMDRGIPVRARKAGRPGTGDIELMITRRGFPVPPEAPEPPTVRPHKEFRKLDLD